MPSDVSDEVLERLCDEWRLQHYRHPSMVVGDSTLLLALAKRIRDLTAARCISCQQRRYAFDVWMKILGRGGKNA